jgi:hypothetical protein
MATPSLIELSDVLKNITSAFIIAKDFMDETSLQIAKKYSENETLSLLSLPFFTISDVTLQLKFAIRETGEKGQVYVYVDTASLDKLPEHIVSQIEVKLNPQSIKVYKTEEGTAVHASTS